MDIKGYKQIYRFLDRKLACRKKKGFEELILLM